MWCFTKYRSIIVIDNSDVGPRVINTATVVAEIHTISHAWHGDASVVLR